MREVEDTHFWYVGMRLITATILDKLHIKKSAKILDAGCGTGGNLQFLARYGKVTGLDISPLALKLCATRGSSNLQQGSINKLPFRTNAFDLITCLDVLGHKQVKQTRAMSEFFRVLKPGGTILIRVAAYPWLYSRHDYVVQNHHRYTKSSLYDLTLTAGFVPTRHTYANMFLFPLIATWRILTSMVLRSTRHLSDTWTIPPLLNNVLTLPLQLEAVLLNYFNLPFGLSLVVLAHKPRKKHAKLI